jgi:alpha-tubulin suppressor-like RCC1 family protein
VRRRTAATALAVVLLTAASATGPATAGRTGGYNPPPVAVQPTPSVAVGGGHVVAIGLDRRVYAAGSNRSGQLTGADDATTLTAMSGLPDGAVPKTVAAGNGFSLVLTYDGRVFGTGSNSHGQLTGTEDRQLLAPLTGLPTGVLAMDIAAGQEFALVLGSDGVVYGTGDNGYGQLTGTGDRDTLTAMAGFDKARAIGIAAGAEHSLVVLEDGGVVGTGRGEEGELTGSSSSTELVSLTDDVLDGITVVEVAAGSESSYLLTDEGAVYATGGNDEGQLGTGDPAEAHSLVGPDGLPKRVTHVSASAHNAVALGADGTAYIAGSDAHGQAGGHGQATTFVPLATAGPSHQVVTSGSATVVRDLDGVLSGVGENETGMLTGAGPATTFRVLTGQVFASAGTLQVSGPATAGGVRTATVTGVVPAASETSYTWTRDGRTVAGATGPAYLVVPADGGSVVAATARLGRPGFVPVVLSSAGVAVGLAVLQRPRVHGVAEPGHRLRADLGAWASGPVGLAVTWLRDGRVVPGRTRRRFEVRHRDVGHRITVVVTASRPGFASASARARSVKVRAG